MALAPQSDIEIAGEAADTREALLLVEETKPDLVVLDVSLPDGDGITAAHEMIRRAPTARILILTATTSDLFVRRAFATGAGGYALKTDDTDEIISAIRQVHTGSRYLSPFFADRKEALLDSNSARSNGNGDPLSDLSRREREVCDLVLRNLTNQDISSTLGISVKTVETHRARINQKLGVHSTGQLMHMAALRGIIPT
jgi:DNA-binding NarL/FixJ family response regulator